MDKLRNIFGNTHHAPYAVFSKASKTHDNGKKFEFIKPMDCRMGAKALHLMRVLL